MVTPTPPVPPSPPSPPPPSPVPPPGPTPATIEDFKRIELKVGRIVEGGLHPKADRLLVLKVDIGGEVRQVVAGIRTSYPDPSVLVGKSVVVVANLKPALLRGVESQGMILAASDGTAIGLLSPDKDLAPGTKVT